ncbi:hypothetical protein AVEN_214134-1 [Araneus ventricosus]|uniref:RNase H type-1 domain-containing protein n=1 Tax=Araneus ventricosus TaxID=182803 RepID=A0A4Y2C8T5_ARAVE|nr:hypothetical protein AVEN_214134-1 [Araneus ventricosus]
MDYAIQNPEIPGMLQKITQTKWNAWKPNEGHLLKGRLPPKNSIFQAEIIALQEAVKYAQNHQNKLKIWSDSLSSLKALLNQKSNSPIARYIQDSLYNTHNITLGWIRAHVGHLGNEKADELAKEAITSTEASMLTIPLPRSSAKQDLKQRALAKWQRRWDDGINGRSTYEIIKKLGLRNHNWPRQLIQFITGHGPFPSYLFRFGKHPDNCCACREPDTPFDYATNCRLTLSYHLKCPADQHIEAWLKSITNHRLLRNKIIDLLIFITSQEDLLKSEQPE